MLYPQWFTLIRLWRPVLLVAILYDFFGMKMIRFAVEAIVPVHHLLLEVNGIPMSLVSSIALPEVVVAER
jgi:hypothetical protein